MNAPGYAAVAGEMLLDATLGACSTLARPLAYLHSCGLAIAHPDLAVALSALGGAPAVLRRVWDTRLARGVFRLLGAGAVRAREAGPGPPLHESGRLLAVFHSPWNRVLARSALLRDSVLVLAGNPWRTRLDARRVAPGYAGYRRVIRHLRAGGVAVVVTDRFGGRRARSARFLGRPVRLSTTAVRIAAAARVPLVPVATTYERGAVQIRCGHRLRAERGERDETRATREILAFFESAVRRDPGSWVDSLAFLSAPLATDGGETQAKNTASAPIPGRRIVATPVRTGGRTEWWS